MEVSKAEREGAIATPAAKPLVKVEPDLSPRTATIAGEKENSEPMETASSVPGQPSLQLQSSGGHSELLQEVSGTSPQRVIPSQKSPAPMISNVGYPKSSSATFNSTTELRSIAGTPQSWTQFIANIPNSVLSGSLEGLSEFQSPGASGLFSPIGSTRLGKKRPLSISPLSCTSSVNIDALVRGSPSSLMGYFVGSRSSSAGSFGHLSPSLYVGPAGLQTYSRPVISLAKAVHPPPNNYPITNPRQERQELAQNTAPQQQIVKQLSQPQFLGSSQEGDEMSGGEANHSDISPTTTDAMPLSNSQLGKGDTSRVQYPNKNGSHKSSNRTYYSYPITEQPHNNLCRWKDCSQQCESLEELVRHVNTDHIYQDSKREFVCYWDGCVRNRRSFKAQYMLLVHMRRHTGEKPHKCHYDGCEKAYSRLENLKTHLRSHTGERPYICKVEGCAKAFSNASDCAKHMNRTHSDEKPYACLNPGCTKRYTDPSSRRKHMKNCQVNKKLHTAETDITSGADESAVEVTVNKTSPSAQKRISRPRKSDRKKKEDARHIYFHSQPIHDNGYSSSGSNSSTYNNHMTNHAHINEYNSSGYETEYSSDVPLLIHFSHNEQTSSMGVWPANNYSYEQPVGHIGSHTPIVNHPPSYGPLPRARTSRHSISKPSQLSILPEVTIHAQLVGHAHIINRHPQAGAGQHNSGITDFLSSGYSSSYSDQLMRGEPPSDDATSLSGSMNSSGGHSLKSEYTNSHSSFSTYSSRLSSPTGSSHSRDHQPLPSPAHRSIQPPDHILRHHHQSLNSIKVSDLKPPFYRRHSDEMSIRSSHSSRYSGSEYSDDYCPPMPANAFSPHPPLPLPQSMCSNPSSFPCSSPPSNSIHSSGVPSVSSDHGNSLMGGSLPLRHYEINHTHFHKPPLPAVDGLYYDRVGSPNMVIGNMSSFSEQLHQESMLIDGILATNST